MERRGDGIPQHMPAAGAEAVPGEGQRRHIPQLLVLLVIVAAAVLAAHWPALSAQALSFDDGQYLVENERDYLLWMQNGDFTDETKIVISDALSGIFPTKESNKGEDS